MRVLIAADDRDERRTMRRALEDMGHSVEEAADGVAALRMVRQSPAEVLIVDIYMPNKDGLETISELRRSGSPIKIVAIGGGRRAAEDHLRAALDFGADACLERPVCPTLLERAVRDLAEA